MDCSKDKTGQRLLVGVAKEHNGSPWRQADLPTRINRMGNYGGRSPFLRLGIMEIKVLYVPLKQRLNIPYSLSPGPRTFYINNCSVNPYLTPIRTTVSVRHSGSAVTRWCLWEWCKMGKETVPCMIWSLVAFQGGIWELWCRERSLCWLDCQESQTPWICWLPLQLVRPSAQSTREDTAMIKGELSPGFFCFWSKRC